MPESIFPKFGKNKQERLTDKGLLDKLDEYMDAESIIVGLVGSKMAGTIDPRKYELEYDFHDMRRQAIARALVSSGIGSKENGITIDEVNVVREQLSPPEPISLEPLGNGEVVSLDKYREQANGSD